VRVDQAEMSREHVDSNGRTRGVVRGKPVIDAPDERVPSHCRELRNSSGTPGPSCWWTLWRRACRPTLLLRTELPWDVRTSPDKGELSRGCFVGEGSRDASRSGLLGREGCEDPGRDGCEDPGVEGSGELV
jgi:hypothetical protein